ncbi:MAG: hypothetical protein JOS17DRAFT_758279 [Linnemannia elongata]|nr:MAG: hypothetical protein JOS17DRAFT_758279 [Linnemannia elongata]
MDAARGTKIDLCPLFSLTLSPCNFFLPCRDQWLAFILCAHLPMHIQCTVLVLLGERETWKKNKSTLVFYHPLSALQLSFSSFHSGLPCVNMVCLCPLVWFFHFRSL